MDVTAHALEVLDRTCYAVLATADDSGRPWATPVWFAHDGLERLYWLSYPGARHSQLIASRPEIAVTVFDSSAPPLQGTGFYAVAHARQCVDDELESALRVVDERARAEGIGGFSVQDTTGDARLRVYVAEVAESWVLDQEAEVDQRAPVPPVSPDHP